MAKTESIWEMLMRLVRSTSERKSKQFSVGNSNVCWTPVLERAYLLINDQSFNNPINFCDKNLTFIKHILLDPNFHEPGYLMQFDRKKGGRKSLITTA